MLLKAQTPLYNKLDIVSSSFSNLGSSSKKKMAAKVSVTPGQDLPSLLSNTLFAPALVFTSVHFSWNAYSNLLSKIPIFSMVWQTFRVLQYPYQSGSKLMLIRSFQKGKTCLCTSRGNKITGCQIGKVLENSIFVQ